MSLKIKAEIYLIILLLEETEDQLLIIPMIGTIAAEKFWSNMKEFKKIILRVNTHKLIL